MNIDDFLKEGGINMDELDENQDITIGDLDNKVKIVEEEKK